MGWRHGRRRRCGRRGARVGLRVKLEVRTSSAMVGDGGGSRDSDGRNQLRQWRGPGPVKTRRAGALVAFRCRDSVY